LAAKKYERGYNKQDPREFSDGEEIDYSLKNLTILNLIKSYQVVLQGIRPKIIHPIEPLDYTPETQRDIVLDMIHRQGRIEFKKLMESFETRLEVICSFLAILQLALEGFLELTVEKTDLSDFYLQKRENELIT